MAAIVLVVLSAISVNSAAFGYWVHNVVLDTDEFMELVEPVITSEEFTTALSQRLSDEVIDALDLEARLEANLAALDEFIREQLVEAINPDPVVLAIISRLDVPRFADLAVPISAAAEDQITKVIHAFVTSDAFQNTLLVVVRAAHEAAVLLVTTDVEDFENLYVEDGEVKWNVVPLVTAAIERVVVEGILGGGELTLPDLSDNPVASEAVARLQQALDVEIPDDFGQITVMSEDDLLGLGRVGRAFDAALLVLILTSVVLIAATLWVSPHRRRTLVQLGVGTVIALVLAALAIRATTAELQDSFTDSDGQAAARAVMNGVIASLRNIWIVVAITAIVVAVVAYLAGRPGWFEGVMAATNRSAEEEPSDLDSVVARHFDLLSVVIVALGLLVLWVTNLNLVWFLVVLVVVGGFVWYGQSARQRIERHEKEDGVTAETDETLHPPRRDERPRP